MTVIARVVAEELQRAWGRGKVINPKSCCSSTYLNLEPWYLGGWKSRRAVNAEVVRSAAEQLNIIPFCLQKKKRCAAAQKKWKNFHQNKYGLVFGA